MRKVSKLILLVLLFELITMSVPAFADNYDNYQKMTNEKIQQIVANGINKVGIPYTIEEMSTRFIMKRDYIQIWIDNLKVTWTYATILAAQQCYQNKYYPNEFYYTEDVGGNGPCSGWLKETKASYSAGTNYIIVWYSGYIIGQP